MSFGSRSRGARAVRVALFGLAAAHLVDAVLLRRARRRLTKLPTSEPGARSAVDDLSVLATPRVEVDPRTLAAVAAEMDAVGAEVVDLVPGDLPLERALRLLRRVDSARLSTDPLYSPGGAHEALVVHPSTRKRLELADGFARVGDRGELLRATVKAQRYAPTAAEVRLAPALRSAPQEPDDRWRELEEATASTRLVIAMPQLQVGLDTLHLLTLTAGVVVAPAAGLAVLATWSAKPAVVFGPAREVVDRTSFQPRDLRGSLLRLPRRWDSNVRTIAAGFRRVRAATAQRKAAGPPVVPRTDELFEQARTSCPACDASSLTGVIDTTDLLQRKPGRFHLDECRDCGHIFQNPALSLAGLEYYYSDFYDGPSEEYWEATFASGAKDNGPRLRAVERFSEPRAWLDVGTGHGHFCLVARQKWPDTVFDGLDMGESVEEAERRGWVDTAYRGLFPEMAGGLPRSYDVVSMFHYLEHTRDPWRELEAAAKVLEPGGHLMIEVPDPASPWGRRLGRYWFAWLQPQHQHFLPCENMITALEEAGFEVLSVERGAATMKGSDLLIAVALVAHRLARSPHAPWLPYPSVTDRLKRVAVMLASVPFGAGAAFADWLKDARLDPAEPGNAYRILARRR